MNKIHETQEVCNAKLLIPDIINNLLLSIFIHHAQNIVGCAKCLECTENKFIVHKIFKCSKID